MHVSTNWRMYTYMYIRYAYALTNVRIIYVHIYIYKYVYVYMYMFMYRRAHILFSRHFPQLRPHDGGSLGIAEEWFDLIFYCGNAHYTLHLATIINHDRQYMQCIDKHKNYKNYQRSAKAPVAKTRKLIVDPPKKMTYRYTYCICILYTKYTKCTKYFK